MKRLIFLVALFAAPSFADSSNEMVEAINRLRPGSEWTLEGENYNRLVWISTDSTKPTRAAISAEIVRLRVLRRRESEYPTVREKVDALLVGGQAVQDIKDRIAAIDQKYPMP